MSQGFRITSTQVDDVFFLTVPYPNDDGNLVHTYEVTQTTIVKPILDCNCRLATVHRIYDLASKKAVSSPTSLSIFADKNGVLIPPRGESFDGVAHSIGEAFLKTGIFDLDEVAHSLDEILLKTGVFEPVTQ